MTRLDGEQLAVIEDHVRELYQRFKQRVMNGRKLEQDKVEELSGGRVWTGRQALSRNLVDEMGDLVTAIDKVRTLAGLDDRQWTPTVWIMPQGGLILPGRYPPQPFGLDELLKELIGGAYLAQSQWHLNLY
jgi:ClpP class serine protease